MAHIIKLSIRGIRSFSHEYDQVIEFYSPLTMIVGANGCGKTTIIECLKYACTGSLPPGSRNGQTFVHDPKVSGINEVKANIKLRFVGRDLRMTVVVRAFQLTQKRATLQFKALDGVISTEADDGVPRSINHKCTDLDKNIPLRMGVSKAILENVVFCHQEDSNWPLQEGAVVKKKFDDIFESARYAKALDAIKKTKQDYASSVKDLKADLVGLQERLRSADSLKEDLAALQENHDGIRQEKEAVDERIRALVESVKNLKAVANEVDLLVEEKQSLERESRDLEVRIAEKLKNIGGDLSDESDAVLADRLREFDDNFKKLSDEVRFFEAELQKCINQATEGRRRQGQLQAEVGSLKAQIRGQDRAVADRDGILERLANEHGILVPAWTGQAGPSSGGSGSVTRFPPEYIATFKEELGRAVSEAHSAHQKADTEHQQKANKVMSELNELKVEEQSCARAVDSKEQELHKIRVELAAMTQAGGSGVMGGHSQSQLASVTTSQLDRKLKGAEAWFERAKKELDHFVGSGKKDRTTEEISELDRREAKLKEEIEREEGTVRQLSAYHSQEIEMKAMSSKITDDESRLEEKCRESFALRRSLDRPIEAVTPESLTGALDAVRDKGFQKDQERASREQEVTKIRQSNTEKTINLGNVQRELSKVSRELSSFSGSMDVVRSIMEDIALEGKEKLDPMKDFHKALKFGREKVEEAGEELADQVHQRRFIKKQLKAARTNGHVCPTCVRHMNEEEFKRFEERQEVQIKDRNRGANIEAAKAKKDKAAEIVKTLEDNAQGWREWLRLSSRAAKLDVSRKKIEEESAEVRASLSTSEKELERVSRERTELDHALSEADKLVEESDRIQRSHREVNEMKTRMERFGSGGSLSEAQERLRDLSTNKDEVVGERQAKEKELRWLGDELLNLTKQLGESEMALKEAATNLEKKREFDEKKKALWQRERDLEAELRDLRAREQSLRWQTKDKERQNHGVRTVAITELRQLQDKMQRCARDAQDFGRVQENVDNGAARRLPEALASVEAQLTKVVGTVAEMDAQAKANELEVNNRVMMSGKQEQAKKVLKDNIDYRGYLRDMNVTKAKVDTVVAKIAETDSGDVQGQISDLNKEYNQRSKDAAELRGRLHTTEEQIRGLQTKLMTDTYKHIEDKHRRKLIEHRTTEMAVADLDKYWTALDKALLRFHTMKIADINKIIRELWAMTYTGEDIDMIEIVSGEDGEDGGRAKRSYNYRVVMRKNDATLDMKGRCSAGQRVLASVVIRLALAETFCVSCGILALDEPTTNLDRFNKVGLAQALAKIISNRSRQSNFQLITITHDEDFVQTMREELGTQGGFSMPEYYWRISRREESRGKFYSRIDRHVWEDM